MSSSTETGEAKDLNLSLCIICGQIKPNERLVKNPTSHDKRSQLKSLRIKEHRGQTVFKWNRVFSLRWPASIQIYWNKRKRLHKKRVQLPQDWSGTPTWPPFHCFRTPIWPTWRHVKTLYKNAIHRVIYRNCWQIFEQTRDCWQSI